MRATKIRESKLSATEDKIWLPPLSPKEQKKVSQHRRKPFVERMGFAGKTPWDWLPLLIQVLTALALPVALFLAAQWFSTQQSQASLQIAYDQQQETILKTYLDDMSDLLLNHNLHKAKPEDEVALVAKERTLAALRRLDGHRNRVVLQFLKDAHLVEMKNAVIDLINADLSGDDLSGVFLDSFTLSGVNLSKANLSGALLLGVNLSGAYLSGANLSHVMLDNVDLSGATLSNANLSHADSGLSIITLSGAYLNGANLSNAYLPNANLHNAFLDGATLDDATLSGADLSGAFLNGATLSNTDLSHANLSHANLSNTNLGGADLSGADLSHANLYSAEVTQNQLDEVKSLLGAIMPDGSIHHS